MDVEMKFAWVPPGSLTMGKHRVVLSQGYYIGVYPVTQAQFRAVMGFNPAHFRGEDRPVEMTNWDDAVAFCAKLRQLTGKPIRLPTEAEWHHACLAGENDYHSGSGEEALKKAGWYVGNSGNQTHPVGKLLANAFGLYDMHGNVWEWCADWWAEYPNQDRTDPTGPSTGGHRVMRGGAWHNVPDLCKVTYRAGIVPESRRHDYGFRVCFRPE